MLRACQSCGRTFHGSGARCYGCEPRAQGQRRAGRIERGYDRGYQLARLEVIGGECELRLPGCTGWADTADHVVPVSRGGARGALRGACAHCNSARGARRVEGGGRCTGNERTHGNPRPVPFIHNGRVPS